MRVGINGFGRIGRGVFRAGFSKKDFHVVAINDLDSPKTLAHLLQYDSVHGRFPFRVAHSEKNIQVQDTKIAILKYPDPKTIPWSDYDVDIVLECSGHFTKKEKAALHLRGSVKKVLISAPSSDADITIVLGVNEKQYNPKTHKIISNASCTTNCLGPIIKVLHENFTIVQGMMTTVHSYTNDQRILDLPHKDLRRARAAACSIIPTTTGASEALTQVYPELKNKLSGLSIRVPTPCVSLIDFVAEVKSKVTTSIVNKKFKEASQKELKNILGYSEEPLVSSDYLGDVRSSVVDAELTQVVHGNLIKVISWYDNETAFSHRMVELAQFIFSSVIQSGAKNRY